MDITYEYFMNFLKNHNKPTLLKWCPDCKDLTLHGFGSELDTTSSPVKGRKYMFCMGCGKWVNVTPWFIV